jgi:hypothetical protein
MLLLRVPLGVTLSALIARAGVRNRRGWMTLILAGSAILLIVIYAMICAVVMLPGYLSSPSFWIVPF